MSFKQFDHLTKLGIYPDNPALSLEEWKSIVEFYTAHSPENNPVQDDKVKVVKGGTLFKQELILNESGENSQTTMVRFVPSRKELWLGNRQNNLRVFGIDGKKKFNFRTPSPIVDAIVLNESVFLSIGNMLPNEDRNGRLFSMDQRGSKPKLILDSLHRPVQVLKFDFTQDGIDDWVIAEFGWETGQVRMINGQSGLSSILSSQPGARNMILKDLNNDGLQDLVVLFAQAKEQVSCFFNNGHGEFNEKVLLKFPSVYGSSFLEMKDMNNDGSDDLIISNGDNADYSLSLKAFQGLRIYLNNGQGDFAEKWFYPAYGATKAIARDFDNDGDFDMAMIAFFSDKEHKGSFLYFENLGDLHFKPWDMNVPEARWLVMEANDMDGDGDQDILLGNFQFGSESLSKDANTVQALLLENKQVH
jgi:hypothetical protein